MVFGTDLENSLLTKYYVGIDTGTVLYLDDAALSGPGMGIFFSFEAGPLPPGPVLDTLLLPPLCPVQQAHLFTKFQFLLSSVGTVPYVPL